MIPRTPWFEREFTAIDDNGRMPGILERLDGTVARLRAMLAGIERASPVVSGWTIAQEVGHLIDLEGLWILRVRDIIRGEETLTVADLTNRATHEADHDRWTVPELIARFETSRAQLVAMLRAADGDDLERTSRHPRLGSPMRLIDHAYFIAEHDDHHLARIRELLSGSLTPRPIHA